MMTLRPAKEQDLPDRLREIICTAIRLRASCEKTLPRVAGGGYDEFLPQLSPGDRNPGRNADA